MTRTPTSTSVIAPWKTWPPRQLTGRPHVFHGYVGDADGPIWTCGHDHHRFETAGRCADRKVRWLNRVTTVIPDAQ